jgi:hypothetical protein
MYLNNRNEINAAILRAYQAGRDGGFLTSIE